MNQSSVRFAFGCAFLGMLLIAGNLRADLTESKWIGTPGETPAAAATWHLADNWDNGIPNDASMLATIIGLTGYKYIRLGQATTLGAISGTFKDGNRLFLLGDETLTFEGPSSGRNYLQNVNLYAPFKGTKDIGTLSVVIFAGDVDADQLTIAGGNTYHAPYYYANSSSEDLTDLFKAKTLYQGSGHIALSSPRCSDHDVSATFSVTEGSKFVTSVTVPGTFIPTVGAVIESEAFPAGTFAKRRFDTYALDSYTYEMSAPATASGNYEIVFKKYQPRVVNHVATYQRASYVDYSLIIDRYPAAGEYRLEVDKFIANRYRPVAEEPDVPSLLTLNTTSSSYLPGTFVLRDATEANIDLRIGTAHLEFDANPNGASGLPKGYVRSTSSSSKLLVTVTNNVSATLPVLSWTGTITKNGAGTLALGLTNSASAYTGSLVVSNGTVTLPKGAYMKNVTVVAGATLQIDGDFAPAKLTLEDGAKVIGTGAITLSDASKLTTVEFAPTVQVSVPGGVGSALDDSDLKIVGTPAFWVDASKTTSFTFKDGDGVNITRVNDVRKTSENDGYLFATNVVNCPTLAKSKDGTQQLIEITKVTGTCDITLCKELVWNRSITNIVTVFQVLDTGLNGGQFLGATARLRDETGRTGDYVRDASAKWNEDVIFHNNSSSAQALSVVNGELVINNVTQDHTWSGYAYGGGPFNLGGANAAYAPQVVDLTVRDVAAAADCFSFDYGNGKALSRNGGKHLFELLVYTNKLTYAEKVQIRGYLMKKWMNAEISQVAPTVSDVATFPSLSVAAGDEIVLDEVGGAGTVSKSGAGSLCISRVDSSAVNLTVTAGKMTLSAVPFPTAATLPTDGLLYRMDATDESTFTFSGDTVKTWTSSTGSGTWTAGGTLTRVASGVGGKPAVDMGAILNSADRPIYNQFIFARTNEIRSVFIAENTADGGSTLLGSSASYSYEGILRGNWYTRYKNTGAAPTEFLDSDPIVASDYTPYSGVFVQSQGSDLRLNGADATPGVTGFTGGDDVVSFVSRVRMSAACFDYQNGHFHASGGGKIGEFIAYTKGLSKKHARDVEAYLRKKWQGVETEGYGDAEVGAVTVGAGATLEVVGGAALKATSLNVAGTGSVVGDIDIGTVLVATVLDNGTIGTTTVNGKATSSGGTVSLAGALASLEPGTYRLLSATSADLGTWTFVKPTDTRAKKYDYVLTTDATGLVLKVVRHGFTFKIR